MKARIYWEALGWFDHCILSGLYVASCVRYHNQTLAAHLPPLSLDHMETSQDSHTHTIEPFTKTIR